MNIDKIRPFSKPNFYGRKKGRPLGAYKSNLMESLLPIIEFDPAKFSNDVSTYHESFLEIGFGGGEHMASFAAEKKDSLCIGAEVFKNGVASLLEHIERLSLKNIKIYADDVRELLPLLPMASLNGIFVLFPDPWPKTRHHERRIINTDNLRLFAKLLKPEGFLTIASDDPSYLEQIKEVISLSADFILYSTDTFLRPSSVHNIQILGPGITRYEEKALLAGRIPQYFVLIKP